MIGIKTAEAVITDFEILLLANTQEFSLAFRFYTIRSLVFVQGANFMFSRCLIYKVHSAKRNSFNISCHQAFVKNFFRGFSISFSPLS